MHLPRPLHHVNVLLFHIISGKRIFLPKWIAGSTAAGAELGLSLLLASIYPTSTVKGRWRN
ncbi:hypothetical protein LEMLEM_LOCUS3054 [Lemmus lemmus]